MMRHGDKLASYRILGEALAGLLDLDWSLEVVGDGVARSEVTTALSPLGSRITWCGALSPHATARRLADADLYVWPAINEAFGMALLEAQASGLPVVAGDSRRVAGIVAHELTGLLVPPGDAVGFAAAVRRLLIDCGLRRHYGAAARRRVLAEHDLPVAAARIERDHPEPAACKCRVSQSPDCRPGDRVGLVLRAAPARHRASAARASPDRRHDAPGARRNPRFGRRAVA